MDRPENSNNRGNSARDTSAPFGDVNAQGSTQTSAQGAAEDVAQEARARAGEVRDEAVKQAKRVGDDVRRQLEGGFGESKNEIARQIDGVARGIRRSSSTFRGDNQTLFADYGDRLAESIEGVSDYLRDRDAGALWGDVQRLARSKPGLFYGGVLAAGILGAQLLKGAARTRPVGATYTGRDDTATGYSAENAAEEGARRRERPVRSYDRKIITAEELDAREGENDGR